MLYDLLVYIKSDNESEQNYLVECDRDLIPDILKHLKTYKLRKKVCTTSIGVFCSEILELIS